MDHLTQLKVELYHRKQFQSLGLFEKQLNALNALEDFEINELLYGGASRAGKSVLGCLWQIMRRLSMPESFGLIARAEYAKLRDTTYLTFLKLLKELGLKRDIDYHIGGIPVTIEFANGSRVFFREIKYIPSDPEFDRLGSYDLTDAFLDEAQQIHHKATQVLKGRFSVTNGNGWHTIPKVLYTCNPSKNWIYSDFVKPAKDGILEKRKKFIAALPSDNPYVPESFFKNLETADKTTRERLLYGNFEYDDNPHSLINDYDSILDLWTNNQVKEGIPYITCDAARFGSDKAIILVWKGWRVIDYKVMAISKTTEIADEILRFKQRYLVANRFIIVDADGVGGGVVDQLNCKGFVNNSSPLKTKNNHNYDNLKSQCAFMVADKINESEIFIVCDMPPVAKEEIKEELTQLIQMESDGKKRLIKKDDMKQNIGRSPDWLDAFIMRGYFDLRKSKSVSY